MKWCSACEQDKPFSDFGKNKTTPDGYQYHCLACSRLADATWREANRDKSRKKARAHYHKTKDRFFERFEQAKAVVFRHYGGACYCCGETEWAFLTIDHADNSGRAERKAKAGIGGSQMYFKIIERGFPTHLRLACWNCNCGRARNNGVCPHEQRRQDLLAA